MIGGKFTYAFWANCIDSPTIHNHLEKNQYLTWQSAFFSTFSSYSYP